MNNNRGFTLMELMIVVAVISILASMAVPEFKRWTASMRLSESVQSIHAFFQGSRMEAIKEGRNVVVAFSMGTGSLGTYTAFLDNNGNGVRDAGERSLGLGRLASRITMEIVGFDQLDASKPSLERTHFDSRGLATGCNGWVVLRDDYGDTMRVILNSSGTSRVERM